MSRSGYSDDGEQWDLIRWRGAVTSSIRGKRGQAFLIEMRDALLAMPDKRLIQNDLEISELRDEWSAVTENARASDDGMPEVARVLLPPVCAIGAVGRARGVDMARLDPDDYDAVAATFGIASPLAQEIVYMNDEWFRETPEQRYTRMLAWVRSHIKKPAQPAPATTN